MSPFNLQPADEEKLKKALEWAEKNPARADNAMEIIKKIEKLAKVKKNNSYDPDEKTI